MASGPSGFFSVDHLLGIPKKEKNCYLCGISEMRILKQGALLIWLYMSIFLEDVFNITLRLAIYLWMCLLFCPFLGGFLKLPKHHSEISYADEVVYGMPIHPSETKQDASTKLSRELKVFFWYPWAPGPLQNPSSHAESMVVWNRKILGQVAFTCHTSKKNMPYSYYAEDAIGEQTPIARRHAPTRYKWSYNPQGNS